MPFLVYLLWFVALWFVLKGANTDSTGWTDPVTRFGGAFTLAIPLTVLTAGVLFAVIS